MKKFIIFSIIILAALSSCEKDEGLDVPTMSKHIGYEVSLKDGFRQGKTKSGLNAASELSVCIDEVNGKLREKSLFLHTETEGWKNDTLKTKGSILSSLSGFGISAWLYKDNYEAGKPYFENDKHSFAGNTVTTGRYWPQKDEGYSLRFYAYAPLGIVELPPTSGWTDGVPSFNYTVPDNISEQGDLLVASSNVESSAFGNTIQMDFGHALTAVQFMVDDELTDFTINSITISRVKKSGTYTYAYSENGDGISGTQTHDNGDWTEQDGNGTFTLTFDPGFVCNGREDVLNESEDVLFMMPQDLGDEAIITMEGTDTYNGANAVTLSAVIGGDGKKWEKGTKVVYKISYSDISVNYVFEVEDVTVVSNNVDAKKVMDKSVVPYYGQVGRKFSVVSYKQIIGRTGTEEIPVPWYIGEAYTYEEEIDTNPEKAIKTSNWIDYISNTGGPGRINDDSEEEDNIGFYNVISIEPEKINGTSHANMWNKPLCGNLNAPYNLAGDSPTTANCYVIDAPGYYKLPLVYGNSLIEGVKNEGSYKVKDGIESGKIVSGTLSSGETVSLTVNVLTPFINYKGEGIKDPWIHTDTGIDISSMSAEVVWQDEPCIITEIKINEDGYLCFRVREDCICEGNAIVAVKHIGEKDYDGNDVILWSWHIWITDNAPLDNPIDITNRIVDSKDGSDNPIYKENTFNIMKTPLGYCGYETKEYKARTGQIVFYQKDGDNIVNTDFLKVNQGCFLINEQGNRDTIVSPPSNVVYYQYGRKDPFHPAYQTQNKPYYSELREQYNKGYGGGRVGFHIYSDEEPNIYLKDGIIRPGQMYQRRVIVEPGFQSYGGSPLEYNHWITNNDGDWNVFNLWNTNSNILPMFVYSDVFVYDEENDTYTQEIDSYDVYRNLKELIDLGVTKTIYDPSPVGYEMPRIDAFAGFTYEGLNYAGWGFYTNVKDWDSPSIIEGTKGHTFYKVPLRNVASDDYFNTNTSGTMFVGAFGYRNDYSGSIEMRSEDNPNNTASSYDRLGNLLTSSPVCIQWPETIVTDDYNGYCFSMQLARFCYDIDTKSYRPISGSNLSMAFPVMPAKTGGKSN
ncbi:MAG: fimbrillin family protein [Bacteroidales bacterium]|nr:fimbrillin family protein [Bacteroidales bacterium]